MGIYEEWKKNIEKKIKKYTKEEELKKEKIPAIVKRCPKCHKLTLEYDPKTGRYLTPDPIGYDEGLILYTYVQNNPINLIDPLGLFYLSGFGNPGFVNVMPSKPPSWSEQPNNYPSPVQGMDAGVNMHNAIPGQFAILGPIGIIKGLPLIQRGLVSPILNLIRHGTPPIIIFPEQIEQLIGPSSAEASQCPE